MMINPRDRNVRFIYAGCAVLALALFNFLYSPRHKSGTELRYETWLGELEPRLENPALTGTPFPPLVVSLDAPAQNLHLELSLPPDADKSVSTKVERILQMAREAHLFALPPKGSAEISFSVKSDKESFASNFDRADISANSQAQAMVKLLEIYSQQPAGMAKK